MTLKKITLYYIIIHAFLRGVFMEKTSSILENKEIYSVENILDDIALITSTSGKSGLLNIKTNEIVGSFDNYETKWNSNFHFYYQVKDVKLDTLVDFKGKAIRIYDTLKKECIVDNWLIMDNDNYELMLLLDHNNKFHVFKENTYREIHNIFNIEFDYVKATSPFWSYHCEFIIQKNGKFGIYITNSKILTPEKDIIYDNICCQNGLYIYTLNGKKTFNIENNSIWFKDIRFDENNKDIFYGINDDNSISVYYRKKLLFSVNGYDKLKFISKQDSRTNTCLFITEKDGKFGIITYGNKNILTESTVVRTILEPKYDNITWGENTFFLYKNRKTGLMKICDSQIKFIDAHYDEIIKCGNNFYALKADKFIELYDIINIDNPNNKLIKNCENINLCNSAIIYKKYVKFGILFKTFDKKKKNYFNIFGYDSITRIPDIYGDLFKVEKDGKFGIYKEPDQMVIEPIYDSIDIYKGNGSGLFTYRNLHFIVKNEKYKLLCGSNYSHIDDLIPFNNNSYEDIIMLPDIIVFKSENLVEVYDYNKNLVGKFNKNTIIEQVIDDNNKYYLVNDEYYFYKDGVFDKVHITDTMTYSTVYEYKYGTIVVNSYDELTHDKVCKNIEAINENDIDNIMINYYDKSPTLQKKYPTLKKER